MWNYRVIKVKDEDEDFYEVCEVYYDPMGLPMGYCAASVISEKLSEVGEVLDMMREALSKPVIDSEAFKK